MSKTLEKLREARQILDDPSNWTQKELARDLRGTGVSPKYPTAVCWCLEGIIQKVKLDPRPVFEAAHELGSRHGLWKINDSHRLLGDGSTGYRAVLKILDKAIENELSRQGG